MRRATSTVTIPAPPPQISIHALRAEGDHSSVLSVIPHRDFYPRPPCGGRQRQAYTYISVVEFLSTPSVRRATLMMLRTAQPISDFYPRPPCGGRQASTRALRRCRIFLSTPSVRRATGGIHTCSAPVPDISIHALRAEGDFLTATPSPTPRDFYPRPPCGGRPRSGTGHACRTDFYPRPPCGGRPL